MDDVFINFHEVFILFKMVIIVVILYLSDFILFVFMFVFIRFIVNLILEKDYTGNVNSEVLIFVYVVDVHLILISNVTTSSMLEVLDSWTNVQPLKLEAEESTFSMAILLALDSEANTKAIHIVIYDIQVYLKEPIQGIVQDKDVTIH